MGSRVRRIAVPVIGLLAIGAASALIAFAPDVLFPPVKEPPFHFGAPPASGEVARVSAPPVPRGQGVSPSASALPGPTAGAPASSGAIAVVAPVAGGVRGALAGKAERRLFRNGERGLGGPQDAESPGKGHGKAKGHSKPKHHGKALGHSKPKAQGKATGHSGAKHHGKAKGHLKKKRKS